MYSQPLCLVPGSNFGGVVRVYAGENGPNRLDVSFDLDTIEEWIDAYQIKENCTCTWAETDHDDYSCGLVAIELISSRRSLPPPTTRVSICLPNSSTDDFFFFKMFLEKKQSK